MSGLCWSFDVLSFQFCQKEFAAIWARKFGIKIRHMGRLSRRGRNLVKMLAKRLKRAKYVKIVKAIDPVMEEFEA